VRELALAATPTAPRPMAAAWICSAGSTFVREKFGGRTSRGCRGRRKGRRRDRSAAPRSSLSSTAYGIVLQPGGHLEPADVTLAVAAERELVEEAGIDPGRVSCVSQTPAYIKYGRVRAQPEKDEPDQIHLDFG
jgi:8-oxo-dGTP pyrophosphatase MutT (NUDIX family)